MTLLIKHRVMQMIPKFVIILHAKSWLHLRGGLKSIHTLNSRSKYRNILQIVSILNCLPSTYESNLHTTAFWRATFKDFYHCYTLSYTP